MEYEFYHHGILGQKWGVRRYQNEDGTYTQEGLRRYRISKEKYDSANAAYKEAKKSYKEGTGSGKKMASAKTEMKKYRKQMNRDYRQLAKDKKADKGKDLYSEGKTITGNRKKAELASGLIAAGTIIGAAATAGVGIKFAKKFGKTSVAGVINVPGVIVTAGLVSRLAVGIANESQNSKLRAYYAHNRLPGEYEPKDKK